MATDRHQAPSYPLRMPDELKARVQAAAEESGRSLHAELLARLEGSFRAENESFKREIEAQVSSVLARSDTLSLRIDLIKSRMDNLFTRAHLISSETERMAKDAQTDEDFAKAEARIAEYNEIQTEAAALGAQAEQLIAERDAELQRMHTLKEALREYRERLEAKPASRPKT
nr:Arc family DNA-binding protein [Acidovorax temperans]